MVLGMMVFYPWYFVDPIKGTTFVLQSMANGLGFMDSLSCIYIYCNTEKNIMKNQSTSPSFGIQGKNLCVYMFYVLCPRHRLFSCFLEFICRSFLYEVKSYIWH